MVRELDKLKIMFDLTYAEFERVVRAKIKPDENRYGGQVSSQKNTQECQGLEAELAKKAAEQKHGRAVRQQLGTWVSERRCSSSHL